MESHREGVLCVKVMILAAGMGSRMRPLTDTVPKPLAEIENRSLIDHILDRLVAQDMTDIVVNLHHLGDRLTEHLAARDDCQIHFSDESALLLDTGGGVAKALPLLGDAPFFVINGDVYWLDAIESIFSRMLKVWSPEKMDALLLLQPTVSAVGYRGRGDFTMDAWGVISRRPENQLASYVFTGIQILSPRLFESLPGGMPTGPFSLNLLYDRAMENGRLFGLRHDGLWMALNTLDSLSEAERVLKRLEGLG